MTPNPFSQNILNQLIAWPVLNALIACYQLFVYLHVPSPLGFAILFLTIVIRLLLWPLFASQLKAAAKMQKVAPHVNKLREKHKNDPTTLQSEMTKLYKEHGVNPLAGCLPALLQLPLLFWGLYPVLQQVVSANQTKLIGEINRVVYFPSLKLHGKIDQLFFGLSLGQSPSQMLKVAGVVALLIPAVTVLLQFVQSKMMAAQAPTETKTKNEKNGDKKDDDFATAFQTQTTYILPLFIGFLSWTLPLGLSLYWNTFTIFGILQQYQIQGWGGLAPWIEKLRSKRQ